MTSKRELREENASLWSAVRNRNEEIETRDSHIAELAEKVATLTERVGNLEGELSAAQQDLRAQRRIVSNARMAYDKLRDALYPALLKPGDTFFGGTFYPSKLNPPYLINGLV